MPGNCCRDASLHKHAHYYRGAGENKHRGATVSRYKSKLRCASTEYRPPLPWKLIIRAEGAARSRLIPPAHLISIVRGAAAFTSPLTVI